MEVMFSLYYFRKLSPDFCGTFQTSFAGQNSYDECISVSTAVFYFSGCIGIMGKHPIIVYSHISTSGDVQESVIEMLGFPNLISFAGNPGLVQGITSVLEYLCKTVCVQITYGVSRSICNEAVSRYRVNMVSHLMKLINTGDEHAAYQSSGVRSMIRTCNS